MPHSLQPNIAVRRTARLLLRPPVAVDLSFHVDLFSKQELVAHRPHPVPDSPQKSAAQFDQMLQHWKQFGHGRWAIENNGRLIGFGGLTQKAEADGLNISYHLHPASWGNGFALEVVTEALVVAFEELQATKVIGIVRPVNEASRRVLEKAGFTELDRIELDGAPSIRLVRRSPHSDRG